MEEGIESLSLNPDSGVETWLYLAREGKAAAPAQEPSSDRGAPRKAGR